MANFEIKNNFIFYPSEKTIEEKLPIGSALEKGYYHVIDINEAEKSIVLCDIYGDLRLFSVIDGRGLDGEGGIIPELITLGLNSSPIEIFRPEVHYFDSSLVGRSFIDSIRFQLKRLIDSCPHGLVKVIISREGQNEVETLIVEKPYFKTYSYAIDLFAKPFIHLDYGASGYVLLGEKETGYYSVRRLMGTSTGLAVPDRMIQFMVPSAEEIEDFLKNKKDQNSAVRP